MRSRPPHADSLLTAGLADLIFLGIQHVTHVRSHGLADLPEPFALALFGDHVPDGLVPAEHFGGAVQLSRVLRVGDPGLAVGEKSERLGVQRCSDIAQSVQVGDAVDVADPVLAALVLGLTAFAPGRGDGVLTALTWLVAATTVLSGAAYLYTGCRLMNRPEARP